MTDNTPYALVTGAGRGIGRAIVMRLLEAGYEVWGLDIDRRALEDCRARLPEALAPRFRPRVGDVAREADVAAVFDAIATRHDRLDLLVNNAGLADPFNGPAEALSLNDWQRVIDVNLTGSFLVARQAIPLLRAAGGAIVNITSTRAFQSEAHTEAYAATKGGLVALTHALAVSLGPAIRVNAIAPGWIDVRGLQDEDKPPEPLRAVDHAQHPAGRVGRAEDIAGLVLFLAGPEAGFISGQTLVADGGMTRRMLYAH